METVHTAESSPLTPELYSEITSALQRIADRQIALRAGESDFDPDSIDRDDLIENSIVDVLEHVSPGMSLGDMRRAIATGIKRQLSRMDRRARDERAHTTPADEDIEEYGSSFNLGDDKLDFWVMDESLKLSDALADPQSQNPEYIAESKEERRRLFGALMDLQPSLRYTFVARTMDDMAASDVAKHVGKNVEEIERDLVKATQILASNLSGHERYSAKTVQTIYREFSRSFHVNVEAIAKFHGRNHEL